MTRASGLDLGSSAIRFVDLDARKGSFTLRRYLSSSCAAGETPAQAAAAVFANERSKPTNLRAGLTGSDVMMRYLPVPEVEDWRLERLMDFEIRELESRSGGTLATSFNLLPVPRELDDEDTMLLSVVREELLDESLNAMPGVPVQGFSPNAIALYNAYLALGDHEHSTTLIASFDGGTLDLALIRGTDLYFARSVSTGLEKAPSTLAAAVGADPNRAHAIMAKHLDLRLAMGARLSPEGERVTRPLLPLYEPLPTLLGGVVTLCKAQARLRDLQLERVLLVGSDAQTRGLDEFLATRLRVPCTLWNPAEMVDQGELPEDQANALLKDGPASAVALGLALSAADPELYALEILPEVARKKRDFQQRGIWVVFSVLLVLAFLVMDFMVSSDRAKDASTTASRLQRDVRSAEASHRKALDLKEKLSWQQELAVDLTSRAAVRSTAAEMLTYLETELPPTLWMETFRVQLDKGEDFGRPGETVAILEITGKGEEGSRAPSAVFANFGARLQQAIPGGEQAVQPASSTRAGDFEWSLRVVLQPNFALSSDEEEQS